MENQKLNIVTGAFSYTGKYITQKLISLGNQVRTLTGHKNKQNPFANYVSVFPFNFNKPEELVKSMEGATTLYNTYWVRFSYKGITFDKAVENTKTLINAAKKAGVRRIVHVSITNASSNSPLPYFRWKGILERIIIDSKLQYAILRPAVIFGNEDVLINNIAWFLRKFPIFVVFGSGNYRLQPIFVEDMAEIAVDVGNKNENLIIDAVGPEIYNFDELVFLIKKKIKSRAKIMYLSPSMAFLFIRLLNYMLGDVVLTKEEVKGLMANLLVSNAAPTGKMKLSYWLSQNVDKVGTKYTSELKRHYV